MANLLFSLGRMLNIFQKQTFFYELANLAPAHVAQLANRLKVMLANSARCKLKMAASYLFHTHTYYSPY